MFIAAGDLQRLRTGISKLYQDKRVVVAPCRCKLYISRCQKIIDVEGKTSPDWSFFANGVTSLVYNPENHGLLLTLFDVETSRLLWMMKMNENTIVHAPNSTFHIVNTNKDLDEHVGMIYESRDVANLLLNTYELLSQRRQQLIADAEHSGVDLHGGNETVVLNSTTRTHSEQQHEDIPASPSVGTKRTRRSKLLRSLSFHGRHRAGKDATCDRRDRSRTLGPEDFPDPCEIRLARNRRPLSSPNSSDYQWSDDKSIKEIKEEVTGTSAVTPVRLPLSERRSDTSICFARPSEQVRSAERPPRAGSVKRSPLEPIAASDQTSDVQSTNTNGISRGRSFFSKKVKLTRSQSLRVSRKSSDATHAAKSPTNDRTTRVNCDPGATKQRTAKPRSCSDSLLLHGSIVKCIVDTGNAARKTREKRNLMRALSNGRGATTDLCTTEL